MNLFVFNDAHGYNINLVIGHCSASGSFEKNIFINLNKKTIYKNDRTEYLHHTISSFKKRIGALPKIDSVIFCPFDNSGAYFLNELKKIQPSVKVKWIFWSYEYYHQPGMYKKMLTGYSLKFYQNRNSFFNKLLHSFKTFVKRLLSIPVFNKRLLAEGYKSITEFYSFLPQDHMNVFSEINNSTCQYHPISFLSIEQITWNIIPRKNLTNEIMIGHAGKLTANHAEILQQLSGMSFPGKLFLPLQYGEPGYKTEIKKMALEYFGDKAECLEERMDMLPYFTRLSRVGFAVFNFTMQEGLGNILFLLWNGAKIFLKEQSSVYRQFITWGLIVFSVEDDLTDKQLAEPLEEKYAGQNKNILEDMFSETKVKEYWKPLFQ